MSTDPTSQMADSKLFRLPYKWQDGKYRGFLVHQTRRILTSDNLGEDLMVYGWCGIFCG